MEKEIEEAAGKYAKKYALSTRHISHIGFEDGAKWQAKRMYSEEEVIAIVEKSRATGLTAEYLIEQFKKE